MIFTNLAGERVWHNQLYESQEASLQIPDAVLARYVHPTRKAVFKLERLFEVLGDIEGKRILAYGCGAGSLPLLFAAKGATVSGIDISDVAIARQWQRAKASNYRDRVSFSVGTVEALPYNSGSFDLVVGTYILHHLPDALPEARNELLRVLRPSGWAVFIEPVLRSRFVSLLRKLFPESEASPRERPLTDADFAVFGSGFTLAEENFDFLGSLTRYVVVDESSSALRWTVARSLARIDAGLFRVGLQSLARYTLVVMRPISCPKPSSCALQ